MNLGLVLVTYVYNQQRAEWAKRSFESLCKTEVDHKVPMQLTYKPGVEDFSEYYRQLGEVFDISLSTDREVGATGIDRTFIASANRLFGRPEVTHVFLLTDDFVYNPQWYNGLCDLIQRKPSAIAWTIYKSAHERHHRTILKDEYTDHLVTSISGTGAVSREEWYAYAPHTRANFFVPDSFGGGETVDLHHAYSHPGARWATDIDYMNHIGVEGVNCRAGIPEYAVNFAGE